MNAFEELQHRQVEPHHAFEETCATIIKATVADTRRVRVHQGDGGVDVGKGSWGDFGDLTVYQIKYFPNGIGESQKRQIKESYRTAHDSALFKLGKWILCLPIRLSKKELDWFDSWAREQDKPIELLDGDDLSDLLQQKECGAARQLLRDYGVVRHSKASSLLRPEIRAYRLNEEKTSLSYALHLSVTNHGDRTARNVAISVKYTDCQRVERPHDDSWWEAVPQGPLRLVPFNPRHLRGIRPINNGEAANLFDITYPQEVVPPINVTFEITAEDEPKRVWKIVITGEDIDSGSIVKGDEQHDSGPVRENKIGSKPKSKIANEILEAILANKEVEL